MNTNPASGPPPPPPGQRPTKFPKIALRAQLMYRSAVDHSPSGQAAAIRFTVRDANRQLAGAAFCDGGYRHASPQSVELKVQSGIAPGWLAFGSVKWTDWSVLDGLDYTADIRVRGPRWRASSSITTGTAGRCTGGIRACLQRIHFRAWSASPWDRGVSDDRRYAERQLHGSGRRLDQGQAWRRSSVWRSDQLPDLGQRIRRGTDHRQPARLDPRCELRL